MGRPEIRDYLARHSHQYTPEALRAQLIAAGYSPEDVAEAERDLGDARDPGRPTLRSFVGLYVAGLFALTVLLFWLAVDFSYIGSLGVVILGAVLLVVGLVEIWALRRSASVQMGAPAGILAVLMVPVVTVLVLSGLCVSTTGARFALPHQRMEQTVLLPGDGWDSLAAKRLSEQGTLAAIQVEDGLWLLLRGGGRLIVEFASTLPTDAVITGASVEISYRSSEPLAVPIGEPVPQLRVSAGSGDLRDPVVSESALAGSGGEEFHGYASFGLGEDVTTAQDIANLRVTIEGADPKAEFEIDTIGLFVSYHRR